MNQEILQSIIDEFSPEKFIRFFRNKNRSFAPRKETLTQYNDASFKDGLKLGEIKFSRTDSLIVSAFKVKQPLSERSGKKAQYEKGKKILKDIHSDAGIFIFYDSQGNFRFSLIYPETIGTRRQWSNFRRFTYFVSQEFTNKTFLTRIGSEDFSSLNNIKEAFSVEKVTKEFYLAYRKLFEDLVAELSKNHTFLNQAAKYEIETENFAKKLLGQIVFIYFIQKKGWMGVPAGRNWGEGDKNFLVNQFKEALSNKENFFNDYLEPLFYGTLNNPRRDTADPSFSKDFNCRIPFLNGGLFEADYDWKNSFIYLDNNIFRNVFDVFERFNFTVEEESPDDKEVAVDPEMLGKVFENLLPENLRKGTGAYYTPREIVYYMCQESLINYLDADSKIGKGKIEKCVRSLKDGDKIISGKEAIDIDKLLETIKICDPACGSGAFLVGMLNEIVRLRLLLRSLYPAKLSQKSEYQLKKDTIHNCIYGVDIDPGAIEIAKLRLWLALVVDYEIGEIEPLPNLDYRLMCGNSLLEEFEGIKFYNGDDEREPSLFKDTEKQRKISELKKKIEEYFDIHDDEEKRKKRKEINDIKDWLIKTALEKRREELARYRKSEEAKLNILDEKSRKKYFSNWGTKFIAEAKINEVLRNLHDPKKAKPFFIWKLEFIDVFKDKGGFDVVIANPPYLKERDNKEVFEIVNNSSFGHMYHQGKMDYWYYFLHKAIDIVCKDAMISYITSRYWLNSSGAKKLIQRIQNELSFVGIVDIGKLKVFDEVSGRHMVAVYRKNNSIDNFIYKRLENDVSNITETGTTANVEVMRLSNKEIFQNNEIIFHKDDFKLKNTINLGEITYISQGVVEAPDRVSKKAFFKSKRKDVAIGDGVFVLTGMEVEKLGLNKKESSLLKKYIDPSDVDKYYIKWNGKYLIYADQHARKDISNNYDLRHIKKHLDHFKEFITSSNKPYGLHRPREIKYFTNEKIIFKNMFVSNQFALDTNGYFVGFSFSSIIKKDKSYDLRYILAILNSSFAKNWFYKNGKKRGAGIDIGVDKLRSFPIKKATESEQKSFAEVVSKIMLLTKERDYYKNKTKQAKVKEYEREIDQMVYKLYGLTGKEIETIEKFKVR